MRLVHLLAVPFQDVRDLLLRLPKVGDVEVAVLVEHLGVAERDTGPLGSSHLEAHPPHHVLAQVDDRLPGRGLEDRDRADLLDTTNGRPGRSDEDALALIDDADAPPVAVVGARRSPAEPLEPGVVGLAHVDVRVENRAGRGPPGLVRAHDLHPAVLVRDAQLEEERQPVSVDVPGVSPPHVAAVPPVTEHGADHVLAGAELIGDVVGLVLETVTVARPPGCEQLVSHGCAVDLHLVEAEAGHVGPGGLHGTVDREGRAQHRSRLGLRDVLLGVGRDPAGLPVLGSQQAHLPVRLGAPLRGSSVVVPHPDAPRVPAPRLEGTAFVGDVDRAVGDDLAGVPEDGLFSPARSAFCDLDLVRRLSHTALRPSGAPSSDEAGSRRSRSGRPCTRTAGAPAKGRRGRECRAHDGHEGDGDQPSQGANER